MRDIVSIRSVVKLAHGLDALGQNRAADALDSYAAGEMQFSSPDQFGKSIADIVNATVNSVKPESRASFRKSMIDKIMSLSAAELSGRTRNPGAAIGAISSMLKNMLSGKDSTTIVMVLRAIIKNIH